MSDRYAVMGNPIAHSLSPQIHHLFAEQTQQAVNYEKILVPIDNFQQAVLDFREAGGRGLNITVPFKQQAFDLAEECSLAARAAKAVNTISFTNGTIHGDNTDGIGLITDLKDNHHCQLKDKHILLLGAGGAARGVILPLLEQQPAHLVIANRTPDKAQHLAAEFSAKYNVSGSDYEQLTSQAFDIIINATSASLHGKIPNIPATVFASNATCYDMVYQAGDTMFIQWAKAQGIKHCYDGFGMLVEQAAQSFYIWRGIKPATAAIIAKLRATK